MNTENLTHYIHVFPIGSKGKMKSKNSNTVRINVGKNSKFDTNKTEN